MRKIVEKETTFCDVCGKEDYVIPCARCGKEVCWDCKNNPQIGTRYPSSVSFDSSGDEFYCRPCDIILSESKTDARYNAYLAIRDLRNERDRWGKDFERRVKEAEAQF